MNKASEGQKKIAALNLKSMLAIFTVELDNIIKAGQQPAQPEPVIPVIGGGEEPMVVEPSEPQMPMDPPPDLGKKSSSFDMDALDAQALEEQRRLMEQI